MNRTIYLNNKKYTFPTPILSHNIYKNVHLIVTETQINYITSESHNKIDLPPFSHYNTIHNGLYIQNKETRSIYTIKSFYTKPKHILSTDNLFIGTDGRCILLYNDFQIMWYDVYKQETVYVYELSSNVNFHLILWCSFLIYYDSTRIIFMKINDGKINCCDYFIRTNDFDGEKTNFDVENTTNEPVFEYDLIIISNNIFLQNKLVGSLYREVPLFLINMIRCFNFQNQVMFYTKFFSDYNLIDNLREIKLSLEEMNKIEGYVFVYINMEGICNVFDWIDVFLLFKELYFLDRDCIFNDVIFYYNNLKKYNQASNSKNITSRENNQDFKYKRIFKYRNTFMNSFKVFKETNFEKNAKIMIFKNHGFYKDIHVYISNSKKIKNNNYCKNIISSKIDSKNSKDVYFRNNNYCESKTSSKIDNKDTYFRNHNYCESKASSKIDSKDFYIRNNNYCESKASSEICAHNNFIPLIYEIIRANENPEKYYYEYFDSLHFKRTRNTENIYLEYFNDSRLEEIKELLSQEEIPSIPYDDLDLEKSREKSFKNRITAAIGNAYFVFYTEKESTFLLSSDMKFKVKRDEIIDLDVEKQYKTWSNFFYNCNVILSQPKLNSTMNVNKLYGNNIENEEIYIKVKAKRWNKIEPFSKFEVSPALCGSIFGMGLKKEITDDIFLNYISETNNLLLFSLFIGYSISLQGTMDETFLKILDDRYNSKPHITFHLGLILSYGFLFYNTNHFTIKNILIKECNMKGHFLGKENKGKRIWYNETYKVFCTFSLALVCNIKTKYIHLNNSLCELLLNGINFAGSGNQIAKLKMKRDRFSKMEEIFYSSLFENLIDIDKTVENIFKEIQIDLYINFLKYKKYGRDKKNEHYEANMNNLLRKNVSYEKKKNLNENFYDLESNIENEIKKSKNTPIKQKISYINDENLEKKSIDPTKIDLILLKDLENIKNSDLENIDEEFDQIYRKSGLIFYIAFKFLFERKNNNNLPEELYLKLYKFCLLMEEISLINKKYKIMFDTCLITLCLIKNGSCDLYLTRILRRQIKKTQRMVHLNEINDFVMSSIKDEKQFGLRYGDIMKYKMCLGVLSTGNGLFEIDFDKSTILNIIATFFINFPLSICDQELFGVFRYFLTFNLVKKKDIQNDDSLEIIDNSEGNVKSMKKDLDALFIDRFYKMNEYDRKVCIDIIGDYFEKNETNIKFEVYKNILCSDPGLT